MKSRWREVVIDIIIILLNYLVNKVYTGQKYNGMKHGFGKMM